MKHIGKDNFTFSVGMLYVYVDHFSFFLHERFSSS